MSVPSADSMVFVLYIVVRSLIFRLRWPIFLQFDRGLITVICPSVDVIIFRSFWIKRQNLRQSLSAIDWQSKPLLDLVNTLTVIIDTQFKHMMRSLVSMSQYRVATTHRQFVISKILWASKTLDERERLAKILTFLRYPAEWHIKIPQKLVQKATEKFIYKVSVSDSMVFVLYIVVRSLIFRLKTI
jgi:hypothetical protein